MSNLSLQAYSSPEQMTTSVPTEYPGLTPQQVAQARQIIREEFQPLREDVQQLERLIPGDLPPTYRSEIEPPQEAIQKLGALDGVDHPPAYHFEIEPARKEVQGMWPKITAWFVDCLSECLWQCMYGEALRKLEAEEEEKRCMAEAKRRMAERRLSER